MDIRTQCMDATEELLKAARLKAGDLVVVGCSTSEVTGHKIGTDSSVEVAEQIFEGIYQTLRKAGVNLAVQCCEHLNRALVLEKEAAKGMEIVNALPQPKAGGSLATVAYARFALPVLVEHVQADAGLDIGDTLIGMHLKAVAVPVRLSIRRIGEANLVAARVRPKFVGGARAVYDDNLL